jgi:D-alanyl-D-alanine dipeptidase
MKSFKFTIFIVFVLIFSFCKKDDIPTKKNEVNKKSISSNSSITTDEKPEIKELKPDYDKNEWEELSFEDDSVVLDIRYAQTNNFVKKKMYKCGRCFVRPHIAEKLKNVNNDLLKMGYKLKLFDCYRPKPVQEELWKIMPDEDYVAAPWKGSMHNRGIAVDLTIVDRGGNELDMGTPFDFFGEEAHHTYTKLPEKVLKNRKLLKETMEKHGLQSIKTEWWHYSDSSKSQNISEWQWNCN